TMSEARLMLAKLPAAQSYMDQAEGALLKAFELNPNLQEPYLLLARLYVDNRQSEKALAKLNEALAKRTNDVAVLTLMGVIQENGKDFPAARATYERLLAVNPESLLALNDLAYLYSEQFGLL